VNDFACVLLRPTGDVWTSILNFGGCCLETVIPADLSAGKPILSGLQPVWALGYANLCLSLVQNWA